MAAEMNYPLVQADIEHVHVVVFMRFMNHLVCLVLNSSLYLKVELAREIFRVSFTLTTQTAAHVSET